MRRPSPAVLTALLLLVPLSACGGTSDAHFESDGGGYGLSDVRPGSFATLSTVSACVDDGARATVTGVRIVGDGAPEVDGFAVQQRSARTVGASVSSSRQRIGTGTTVRSACPQDGVTASDGDQVLTVQATLGTIARRVRLRTLEIDYRVDGDDRTATVPITLTLCPPGTATCD